MEEQVGGHPKPKPKWSLIPPGAMIQASRSYDFGPIEGKEWEVAVRELTDPQDWFAMAGALARHMGPNNLGNFCSFGLDLSHSPAPGPRVSMVMAQLLADERSTSVEIGEAANWCQNQYVAANLHTVVWADRILECQAGEGAALAKAERELVLGIVRFNGEMQRAYGITGVGLMAAVVGRLLGNVPEVLGEFLASMERSRRIDEQLAKESA